VAANHRGCGFVAACFNSENVHAADACHVSFMGSSGPNVALGR
jgi:hypothetical protein